MFQDGIDMVYGIMGHWFNAASNTLAFTRCSKVKADDSFWFGEGAEFASIFLREIQEITGYFFYWDSQYLVKI